METLSFDNMERKFHLHIQDIVRQAVPWRKLNAFQVSISVVE